jgi:hypothetical protein
VAPLLAAFSAHAQPGPSESLTVSEAQRAGEAYVRARRHDGTAREQLTAAVEAAERIQRLARVQVGMAAGGPRTIEPTAEATLRKLTGFDFGSLPAQVPIAWQECVATAARLHALNPSARLCATRAFGYSPRAVALQSWSMALPERYGRDGADASAALFERTQAALLAAPRDDALRRQVAAMQIASFDFDGALQTLGTLAGQPGVDLAMAVAHLGAGRIDEAERRLAELVARSAALPETQFDLGLLLAARVHGSSGAAAQTLRRRALDALLRFLCARGDRATLLSDVDSWELAAETAAQLEHDLTGGTYWFYRTGSPQPPPFLPDNALPPGKRVGAATGLAPRWKCADVLRGAVMSASLNPASSTKP